MKNKLLVSPEELHAIYLELAEEISTEESSLNDSLPTNTTAGISAHLTSTVDRWEANTKSLRTTPTANVHAREFHRPPSQSILQVLVGLDAQVNVLDDIIDTADLPTQQRVALTANAAFASLLIAEHAPPEHREAITTVLSEYFSALFQIPLVEVQLFEQVRDATTQIERRDASREIYAYRARDIDAFARLPGVVTDIEEQTEKRLLSDLRAYRARRLLIKDIHDVPRDLADNDMTPITLLLATHDSIETLSTEIEQIYDGFEYTTTGQTRYGDMLHSLEEVPDDVTTLLREQKQLVRAAFD